MTTHKGSPYLITLVRPVLGSTSGNAFPPTTSVLCCVESIFPRQFQSSQDFADDLQPIFPRSSSSPFWPWSPVHHPFGFSIHVNFGHMTQPRQSFPSDDAAHLLLSCSFPDYLVWYFIPPCGMQYPPQPSVMRRLQSPAVCYCDCTSQQKRKE